MFSGFLDAGFSEDDRSRIGLSVQIDFIGMILFVTTSLVAFLQPILIHLRSQPDRDGMTTWSPLKAGLGLCAVLEESNNNLAYITRIDVITLAGQQACNTQRSIFI